MVPTEFLRGVLGLLCVFFAHMLGRSAAAVSAHRQKLPRLYAWILRTLVCAAALLFRHRVDTIVIIVYALAVVAFGLGYFDEWRPKHHPEDLTGQIFPK